jgi:anti-sigma B factor antagonist
MVRRGKGDEIVARAVAPFDISVTSGAGCAMVRVRGEVDLATAPKLHSSLRAAWLASHGELAIDLSEVSYLGVTGLRVLLGALDLARASGGDVVLWDPSPMACQLLEITDLMRTFRVARRLIDRTEAMAGLPVTAGALPSRVGPMDGGNAT